eukprot:c10718_g1_i1.p1 GENE.c10718_g1_i1~~c10718_g1_i1.p1  ORF type:complete len:298 (+),score=118.57 c10718_g1_i1:42-896(+)
MRFRCRVGNVLLLLRIAQTLEKVAKSGILHLTPNVLHLIIPGEGQDDTKTWSSVSVTTLFRDYVVESLCNNHIACQLMFTHLIQALKSCSSADSVLLKLTKKDDQPNLSFLIEQTFPKMMTVTHNVPVNLLTSTQILNLKEPQLPLPEIQVYLPPLKELKTAMERMKSVGDYITIECTQNGQLSLHCSTDVVNISTVYPTLALAGQPPKQNTTSEPSTSSSQTDLPPISAQVHLRKFFKVLKSSEVFSSYVICCIVKNQAVVLVLHMDEVAENTITFYVPIVFD